MAKYSQADRPLRIETPLGADVLLPTGFSGSEGVSTPYRFRVDLVSEDPAVDPKKLLRQPVAIQLELPGGAARPIHGLVSRFVQLGRDEDLTHYQAEVVPWLWFLGLTREYRIFQNASVPDILEQVFSDQGYSDYKLDLSGSYAPREFCVQYNESDLDFVSRLMEEEGIYYFFEHTDSAHKLIVIDRKSAQKACPGLRKPPRVREQSDLDEDVVLAVRAEHSVHAGTVTIRDWVYPMVKTVEGTRSGTGREEIYDFAVGLDDNNAVPSALNKKMDAVQRYANLRLEAESAGAHVVEGESTCRAFATGYKFSLDDHYSADFNQEYFLIGVTHSARSGDYRAAGSASFEYENRFTAIPASVQYRPPLRAAKPIVRGSQTALVVGPKGEEIYTDEYGRVKVQFHWDRKGKKDDKSSCWIRVATSWAGKNWGAIQIPRIGQEVVVDFLDGDPDRPIVVGSVYNAEQLPPYKLPDNKTVSGIRSRSSAKGGASNANEIRFEDKKDQEQILVQAEKDLKTIVKNDETREIGLVTKNKGDQTITIHNDQKTTLKEGHQTTLIEKGNQVLTIKEGNQTVTLDKGKRSVELGKGDDALVLAQGGQKVEIKQGKQEVLLGQGDQKLELKMGNQTITLGQGNQKLEIKMGNQTIELGMGNQTTKAKLGKIEQEAMQGIELKVGQSSIKIDQAGVTIKGMTVKVEGTIQTQIKGVITQINGTAMLKAQGGITMIN